jgi:hypothetical protein
MEGTGDIMADKKRALPSQKKTNLPAKSPSETPPVVTEKKGPRKGEGEIPMRRIRGKNVLKDDQALKKEQAKFSPEKKGAPMEVAVVKKPSRKGAGRPSERYVRLRMRVKDGKMSIVASHLVEGSLLIPSTVHGNYVYEVTLGKKRLHLDSIPDLGVKRSFTNLTGIHDETREHITHLTTYEFDIRVPEKDLKEEDLPKINIALYRSKERVTKRTVGLKPLNVQFERELREVARLKGINVKMLKK